MPEIVPVPLKNPRFWAGIGVIVAGYFVASLIEVWPTLSAYVIGAMMMSVALDITEGDRDE